MKNSKELKIIRPTILNLKRNGLRVFGPYSADTVFIKDYKFFDKPHHRFFSRQAHQFQQTFPYSKSTLFQLVSGI